jgi:hypothetical protein
MGGNMYDKLAMQTGQGDGKDREVGRVREINTERTAIANTTTFRRKERGSKITLVSLKLNCREGLPLVKYVP